MLVNNIEVAPILLETIQHSTCWLLPCWSNLYKTLGFFETEAVLEPAVAVAGCVSFVCLNTVQVVEHTCVLWFRYNVECIRRGTSCTGVLTSLQSTSVLNVHSNNFEMPPTLVEAATAARSLHVPSPRLVPLLLEISCDDFLVRISHFSDSGESFLRAKERLKLFKENSKADVKSCKLLCARVWVCACSCDLCARVWIRARTCAFMRERLLLSHEMAHCVIVTVTRVMGSHPLRSFPP